MTVTDHTLAIRNVTIDSLCLGKGGPNQRFALSWELRDARFHIWFDKLADLDPDAKTLTSDFILYKNPPRDIGIGDPGNYWKRSGPGNYWTRSLNPAAKANVRHVEAARRAALAGNLYQKALGAEKDKRDAATRETEEVLRVATVKEAGPALLEALVFVFDACVRLNDAQAVSKHDTEALAEELTDIQNVVGEAIAKAKGED